MQVRILEEVKEDEGFNASIQLATVRVEKEVIGSERDVATKARIEQ